MREDVLIFCPVDENHLPQYATSWCAGWDLKSNIEWTVAPHDIVKIPSWLKLRIPQWHVALVKPRSSLAVKKGLLVIDWVIDSDYRWEISIVVHNLTDKPVKIEKDERIAQLVIIQLPAIPYWFSMNYDKFEEEHPTERWTGWFWSTWTH